MRLCRLAMGALLMGGCKLLQYDGPRDNVIQALVWAVLIALLIAVVWLPRRRFNRFLDEVGAFAAARGLARESRTQIGGYMDGLTIRHEFILRTHREGITPELKQ